jgi:hypothetical protein
VSEMEEIGFLQTGHASSNVHEHQFQPLQEPGKWYLKTGDSRRSYAMLFCRCGDTKEVITEDRG